MKNKTFFTLFFWGFTQMMFGQSGPIELTFTSKNFRGVVPKDTLLGILYEFDEGRLVKVKFPLITNSTDISEINVILTGEKLLDFINYTKSLKVLKSKYEEWSEIVRENKIEDYYKYLDSLLVESPLYEGYFVKKDKFYYWDYSPTNLQVYFWVSHGIPAIRISKGKLVGRDIVRVGLISGKANYVTIPLVYLYFDTPEKLESFLYAFDPDNAMKTLLDIIKRNKSIDKLIK